MTSAVRKKLKEIDNFILLYPKIKTIYVSKEQFEALKDCIPLHHQQEGGEALFYDGRLICKK